MKIAEIFSSIHGEVNGHHQGRMCTFIRISGCNLNCFYCDTKYAQNANYGKDLSLPQILYGVKKLKTKYICITGGEPLLNRESLSLIKKLWEKKYKITVETNGTIDITPFFRYVESFVVDYKVGVENYNEIFLNYLILRKTDVIKFVVNHQTIYNAIHLYKTLKKTYFISEEPIFAFSPIISEMFTPTDLYNSLKSANLHNVLISLQIHKFSDFN